MEIKLVPGEIPEASPEDVERLTKFVDDGRADDLFYENERLKSQWNERDEEDV